MAGLSSVRIGRCLTLSSRHTADCYDHTHSNLLPIVLVFRDLSSGLSTDCRLPVSLELECILSDPCFPLLLKLFFCGRKPVRSEIRPRRACQKKLAGNAMFLPNDLLCACKVASCLKMGASRKHHPGCQACSSQTRESSSSCQPSCQI